MCRYLLLQNWRFTNKVNWDIVTKEKSKAARNLSDTSKAFFRLDPNYDPKTYGISNKSLSSTQSSCKRQMGQGIQE